MTYSQADITVPYAVANFAEIRHKGYYYVDKTNYVPLLERYKAPVFLRPRRFGKSLLVSMLAHYYDRNMATQFKDLFGGTWIGEHPTNEHNQYLVVRYDFSTTSVASKKEDIENRIQIIRAELERVDSDFDREKAQERLAKLSGGVAVLKVGAATESELKEKKSRIEDALQATRAAVEEGIVAGGGVALVDAIGALDAVEAADKDEEVGIDIIRKAIEAPMRAIAQNAGFEGSVVVEKVKSLPKGEGLNCANGEYGNMIEMGVNDPVKVTRTALQSAASVAALILITEATINEIPKEGPDLSALAAGMQGGGGMY